jgi:hypothetical protein
VLGHVLCRFGAYLDNSFCLLVERNHLLAYKVGLNFHDLFQIFGLTKFLYKSNGSCNVFRRSGSRRRQSQRARELENSQDPKDRSGFFAAQLIIEAHFAGRKSLL